MTRIGKNCEKCLNGERRTIPDLYTGAFYCGRRKGKGFDRLERAADGRKRKKILNKKVRQEILRKLLSDLL